MALRASGAIEGRAGGVPATDRRRSRDRGEAGGIRVADVVVVGLDTPGPRAAGASSARAGRRISCTRTGPASTSAKALATRLGKPVTYLNDGNAGALWGHFAIFGAHSVATSISAIIGTGLGGGVIVDGNVVKGRSGFGGELGHVLIPYQSIAAMKGVVPDVQLRTDR